MKGWLKTNGKDISLDPLVIRATDYRLRNLPSGHPSFRVADILTADNLTAFEVKTGGGLLSGELVEDQFEDYLVWRNAGNHRNLVLALVDYYGEYRVSRPTLKRTMGMRVRILRFAINWAG